MKNRSFKTAVVGVVSPVFITTSCFALAESLRLTQYPTFLLSSAFLALRSASWNDLCAAHEEAANQLGDILCDTLKSDDQTEKLRSLRSTWLSLQSLSLKLASGTGAIPALHYTCCMLAVTLLSSVGVLMAILRNGATAVTGAQLLVGLRNLYHIARMHQAGHKASHAVRWAVLRPLLTSNMLDDDTRDEEVLSFLRTIDRNPGMITIGGFTNCSRSALMLFFSTFFTYIVVLIQFAYSGSTEGDRVIQA